MAIPINVLPLTRELKKQGLDAILIAPSDDMVYLTGFKPLFCERFQGLFITAAGDLFYVCNVLSREEIHEHLPGVKTYVWRDGEDYVQHVRQALVDHNLIGTRLGINDRVRAYDVIEISQTVNVQWVSARSLCHELRIRKTSDELADLRRAADIADRALADTLPQIRPGMTEADVLAILRQAIRTHGGSEPEGLVASGPNSSFPHYIETARTIEYGDAILFDFACKHGNMCTDISRTVFLGSVTDKQRHVYELVHAANAAGEAAAVKGAHIPAVEQAARRVIDTGGYGAYFTHRLGHGIGYLGHEAPNISVDNERVLESGMAFTIEPGIYLPGEFGVRIEDCVIINEEGKTEVLHRFTKDLIVLEV